MDEDNSTRLANIYKSEFKQIIVIYPYVWQHEPNQNWFVYAMFGVCKNG